MLAEHWLRCEGQASYHQMASPHIVLLSKDLS